MASEEALAAFEQMLAVRAQRAGALKQPASSTPTEEEADVVADDRRRGGDGDDDRQGEMALVGEHGSREQGGLPGHGHAHRLSGHEPGERQVRGRAGEGVERDGSYHLTSAPTA